ncbi:hypothetical protein QTH91_17515 [Variovorax dokdonensis]|uniref:Uncharacterized protein n=1 Tax=Variovorax dokdonensis TaxID=344883 RepID=A0ABT7NEP1_9BURK|nr:hypothetical protein [Variovorax dokdonensis]MDM0046295.1 hypothetical protein [Variovorax dokdonensis]
MLDTLQKSKILTKAGYTVPAHPGDGAAQEAWTRQIENLYVTYVAARAARSLREAEEARQMERLRALASMRAYA